jgi:hypothetical protein
MLARVTASVGTPIVVAVALALIVYGLVLGFGG